LANNKGVSGRRNYPVGNVGLKVNDAGVGEIEIIPPTGYNRVRLNPCVPSLLEERKKSFPHLLKSVGSAGGRVFDKSIGRATFWI